MPKDTVSGEHNKECKGPGNDSDEMRKQQSVQQRVQGSPIDPFGRTIPLGSVTSACSTRLTTGTGGKMRMHCTAITATAAHTHTHKKKGGGDVESMG